MLKIQHNAQWKKHWSEKTDSSISLTYQQIQKTERTVRQLGEIPTDNKKTTDLNCPENQGNKYEEINLQWLVGLLFCRFSLEVEVEGVQHPASPLWLRHSELNVFAFHGEGKYHKLKVNLKCQITF